jgi:hypothetical protein
MPVTFFWVKKIHLRDTSVFKRNKKINLEHRLNHVKKINTFSPFPAKKQKLEMEKHGKLFFVT